ncbi:Site-specific recombinase XerD [Blastococcus tunisiensis]|uniref:Site-specific recombinase XerD n=1 Tax=Blastococcus tunisiensis TaxID=1798228 RepID=A0A1I2EIG7_9ACTN|nr:Site-specific recombinase XerD [Blastococcus sp. DSM 46838]
MGRPHLELGTHGRVRIYRQPSGYRATCLFRDWDGVTRQIERQATTKGAAERALAVALRDRGRSGGAFGITLETKVADVAEKWFSELEGKSPSTMQAYRDRLDRQVLPALGGVRLREVTVGLLDRHLTTVRATHGPALAKMTKSVLSGICSLACRHDALQSNPCRDVARIPSSPRHTPRSLTVVEVKAVRAWLSGDARASERDLPELVAFMVATGLRIGEACAITWSDVDLDASTVTVSGTVLRVKGQGLVISRPKSAAGERVLELPSWCVEMLRRREASTGPVFPAPRSRKLRDPSNTRRALREAFLQMGMPGVTSHAFRKTVATLMDEAGLSARSAADQLGHAKPSITQDVYYGRKRRATGAAQVLEQLA